jgi:hypothetical protein
VYDLVFSFSISSVFSFIKRDLQEVGGCCGDWMEGLRIGTGGGHL